MAYFAISKVRLRKHWGQDCPTWHFNSFCACVYNRCLPIRGENDHLFALYESILKRMTWGKFFFFCLIFKKMSKLTRLNSKLPSSSHSYQDWTFISDVHGLILVTSVVPSTSKYTRQKKISNPAPVLLLVKNLVSQKQKSENNEQKIIVVRVLVLLKKFYHARRKNGKCKSINQSISQLVACKENYAIYSVFGSHW